jgi:preprotein translocase subunit SecD
MNFKRLIKKFRVMLLLFCIILAVLAIQPQVDTKGVVVRGVDSNSSSYNAGMRVDPNAMPVQREVIKQVNGMEINEIGDYNTAISKIKPSESVKITTNRGEYVFLNSGDIGISVEEKSTSNIRLGLDLKGGTRVLLEPEEQITEAERQDLIVVMRNRLNVYGLSDIVIREADDLKGTKYIIVEVAGATKQEVRELIGGQGKFEARIANATVFEGGEKDVVFVCRGDGTCSGIRSCGKVQGGESCRFEFSITLSEKAAKKHAEITKSIPINMTQNGEYLSEPLDLYLDNKKVDSLLISADLKGKQATDISISGPGVGSTEQEAINDALANMNKLQTILITGSLPTKLVIVKMDSISPSIGEAFVNNAFLSGLLAIGGVALFIFIRYRKLKVCLPIIFISVSEIFLTLGLAALIKYNLDLAAIAGIIAAVGTGVDDQLVITDEMLSGKKEDAGTYDSKKRMKQAFFIILAAYATNVAAMLPLLKAGAGLLTGFAFTTIAGITIGILITRPAFGIILEESLRED